MARFPLRSDLQVMQGYHSAQVDVPIRLNTNEAPFSPPQQWLNEVAEAVGSIAWNRYPDREVTELREGIERLQGVNANQLFVANGSIEVL
jgi:histidinol-phosphate aminotransferase